VANHGSTVAALVRLALWYGAGNRVLPTRYSDNYFWQLPGETRNITVSWPASASPGNRPHLTAQAYNSPVQSGW
jgi:Exo-beta-D-glucosaminidase Ig-fold domain